MLLEHGGYAKGGPGTFDRELGLDPGEVLAFVRATQSAAWNQLTERHGGETVAAPSFLKGLAKKLDGCGTVDVLRHGVKDLSDQLAETPRTGA